MLQSPDIWDVAVIGAGPAGASAALAAADSNKRVIILERFRIPRYKTCGGGLIGASMKILPEDILIPIQTSAASFTFSLNGRFERTKTASKAIVNLVNRDDFDAALVTAAVAAGATLRDNAIVMRMVHEDGVMRLSTRDGQDVLARIVVGADGSAGRSSTYVGVTYSQVDLGLEVELPIPEAQKDDWDKRILIDWGYIPGGYAWVFPKGETLSVGVIAGRGKPDLTRSYLNKFLSRLRLDEVNPIVNSGHLTKCRAEGSPLYRGRVMVAGDAAGLLEPWTREGISFALRSGTMAGSVASQAADAASEPDVTSIMESYADSICSTLVPEMRAGCALLQAFIRHPRIFHMTIILLPKAWAIFAHVITGDTSFAEIYKRRIVRVVLKLLGSSSQPYVPHNLGVTPEDEAKPLLHYRYYTGNIRDSARTQRRTWRL